MECDLAFLVGLDWQGPRIRFLVTIGDPFSLIPLERRNEDVLVGHLGRLKFSGCFFCCKFHPEFLRMFCPRKKSRMNCMHPAPFTVHRATLPDKFHWLALLEKHGTYEIIKYEILSMDLRFGVGPHPQVSKKSECIPRPANPSAKGQVVYMEAIV